MLRYLPRLAHRAALQPGGRRRAAVAASCQSASEKPCNCEAAQQLDVKPSLSDGNNQQQPANRKHPMQRLPYTVGMAVHFRVGGDRQITTCRTLGTANG
jgi:hypothetical protein